MLLGCNIIKISVSVYWGVRRQLTGWLFDSSQFFCGFHIVIGTNLSSSPKSLEFLGSFFYVPVLPLFANLTNAPLESSSLPFCPALLDLGTHGSKWSIWNHVCLKGSPAYQIMMVQTSLFYPKRSSFCCWFNFSERPYVECAPGISIRSIYSM